MQRIRKAPSLAGSLFFLLALFLLTSAGATTISGTVRNAADSTPVVGAKVVLIQGPTRVDSATTDASGNYSLLNVTGGNKQLQTSATGYQTATTNTTVDTTVATLTVNINLTVTVPGSISGLVRSAADSTTPIAGAKLYLRRTSATSAIIDSALTDSTGFYAFSDLVPGTPNYYLAVTATGYVNGTSNNIAVGNGASVTRNFYLNSPGSISGLVRNAADSTTPIAGAKVYLRRTSATSTIIDSITTDSTGAYAFSNLAPGTPNYYITASASGFLSITNGNVALPNGGAIISNFYLQTLVPGSISGTVRSAADSTTPIAGAKVYLRRTSATSAIIDSTTTDALGDYLFDSLTPGTPNYWITASAAGFQSATNANVAIANGEGVTSNLYLVVTVPGTISGTVRSAVDSITPIVGAKVYLRRTSATSAIIDSATTDSTGAYALSNLAPGTPNYYLAVTAAGYVNGASNNIAIGNGATVTRNFYLAVAVPGSITGIVRRATDSTVIAGAKIYLRRSSATSAIIDSATTDSAGVYTFSNVASGTPNYWITISVTGYLDSTITNVAVGNGATVTRNVVMTLVSSALKQAATHSANNFRIVRAGNLLWVNIEASGTPRRLKIYDMTGSVRHSVSISAGENRVSVPAAFSPSNGFILQVK